MTTQLSAQIGGVLDRDAEPKQEYDAVAQRDGELGLNSEAGRLLCADLEVDLQSGTVRRGGMPIALTKKQIDLLTLLLRRQERVVTRTVIRGALWNDLGDSDSNVIDVHISSLRKKVDRPFNQKLIHTVIGMGYSLRAPSDG